MTQKFEKMKFKIDSPEQSARLQKVLFSLGYSWCRRDRNNVQNYSESSIFTNSHHEGEITWGENICYEESRNEEMDTETFIAKHSKPELKPELKPHIHAKLIKLWAEGHTIQYFNRAIGKWCDVEYPLWEAKEYRVKPSEPEIPKTSLTQKKLSKMWSETKGESIVEVLEAVANKAIENFITSGDMDKYIRERGCLK